MVDEIVSVQAVLGIPACDDGIWGENKDFDATVFTAGTFIQIVCHWLKLAVTGGSHAGFSYASLRECKDNCIRPIGRQVPVGWVMRFRG